MRHRFGPTRPTTIQHTAPPTGQPIRRSRHQLPRRVLWLLACLWSLTADAAPELIAGVFRLSPQIIAGEDGNSQLWMRNPLVLDDYLMFRIKEGRWSNVYAYRLDELASGIGTWSVEPAAIGPSRADVLAQEQSPFQAPPIPIITALFRGPAYSGLLPGAVPEGAVSLWTLGGTGFEPRAPDTYKGVLRTRGHEVVATAQNVRVDEKPWLDCKNRRHEPDCKAIVTHGLSWTPDGPGRLAVGFADTGERRHVCVINKLGQACRAEQGNSVAGRLPLLSPDGSLLAVADEQRLDAGRGEHAGWDLVIYKVTTGRNGPTLERLHRIEDIRVYGDTGQGGDFVAYDGSYGWLGDQLFYQRQSTEHSFETWSISGGTRAWSLPSEIAISNPRRCGTPELKAQLEHLGNDAKTPARWDRLIWVPTPGTNDFQRDCDAQGAGKISLRLIDVYAVQPLRLRGTSYVVVQALVESVRRRTPIERILLFRLD